MSIGDDILQEITKQGMFTVAYPDPDEAHVFVWSSGAAEQLEAVVERHVQARVAEELRAREKRI